MKINFSQVLTTLKGEDMFDVEQEKGVEPVKLTLEMISTAALMSVLPQKEVSGKEKLYRYKLAVRVSEGGVVDLKTEEIAKIKGLVGDLYNPLIVGRTEEMLEKEFVPDVVEEKEVTGSKKEEKK